MNSTATSNKTQSQIIREDVSRQAVLYLENMLTMQIKRVKSSDLDGAMLLADEVNELAEGIGGEGILEQSEFAEEAKRIEALYKKLCITIASERKDVSDKLKQVRKGIKMLGAYGGNMRQ
jgi:hypothetical protein